MKIGLIDTSNILHTIKYGTSDFGDGLFYELQKIQERLGFDVIVLGNDIGKSKYRAKLLPTYKAHRADVKKTPHVISREKELNAWRQRGLQQLQDFFPYLGIAGIEFDDMATLFYKRNSGDNEIIIVSQDKDFLSQVPYRNVYDWKKGKTKTLEDRYNLTKNDFIRFQTLLGDTADNIKSFCGEKTSLAIIESGLSFNQLRNIEVVGSLNTDIFPSLTRYNKRYIKKALEDIRTDEGWEQLQLNYKLIKMFDDISYLDEEEQEIYLAQEEAILNFKHIDRFQVRSGLEDFLDSINGISALDTLEEYYEIFQKGVS